jgi:hypothetical protein
MTRIAYSSVSIQTSSRSVPTMPPWFGAAVLLIHHLRKQGIHDAISAQVRFARRRFGSFEVIDFVAVLFGYISDKDLQTEVAAVDFALSKLSVPETDGMKLDASPHDGGEFSLLSSPLDAPQGSVARNLEGTRLVCLSAC